MYLREQVALDALKPSQNIHFAPRTGQITCVCNNKHYNNSTHHSCLIKGNSSEGTQKNSITTRDLVSVYTTRNDWVVVEQQELLGETEE